MNIQEAYDMPTLPEDNVLSNIALASSLEGIQLTPVGLYPASGGNTISKEWTGFSQIHLTTFQLVRVVTQLADTTNRHQSTGTALFNISKAFDEDGHKDLLFKLIHTSILPSTVYLI